MISDTKLFFFFCQSTHCQVLHYAQNKYLKKDLYKAQNAYNASRRGVKKGRRDVAWEQQGRGEGPEKEERGSKVKKVCILQFPPWCHISFVTQQHNNHPGQTRKDAAIYT